MNQESHPLLLLLVLFFRGRVSLCVFLSVWNFIDQASFEKVSLLMRAVEIVLSTWNPQSSGLFSRDKKVHQGSPAQRPRKAVVSYSAHDYSFLAGWVVVSLAVVMALFYTYQLKHKGCRWGAFLWHREPRSCLCCGIFVCCVKMRHCDWLNKELNGQ